MNNNNEAATLVIYLCVTLWKDSGRLTLWRLGISTSKVIEAMNTKWNALGFKPGLVGGHCIGIDPYYLIYKATLNHSSSEIVALARKINNNMSEFVVENIIDGIEYIMISCDYTEFKLIKLY